LNQKIFNRNFFSKLSAKETIMGNKAIIHFPNKVFSSRTIWPIILFLAFFIITSLPQDVHSASADVGTVDKNFVPDVNGPVYTTEVQADGKIIVGGFFEEVNGQARKNIARLNSNGTLDASFKPNIGYAVTSIVLLQNGKILIGGIGEGKIRGLDRLNSDGSLDKDFKPNIYANILSLVVQADGKILLGGLFLKDENLDQDVADGGLARLNPDGTLNKILYKNQVQSIALQDNDKILAGGPFGVARFNSDGSLDNNFNPTVAGEVYKIALQQDGKILMGGSFAEVNGQARKNIARLNPNGSLDSAFKPAADFRVITLAIHAEGNILLGGDFQKINGVERKRLARLNSDGSVHSFKADTDGTVLSLIPYPDGKILVGGYFTTIGGLTRNNIARLIFKEVPEVTVLPGVLMLLLDD
jgi:uncharacterized delta-60 repeat protein